MVAVLALSVYRNAIQRVLSDAFGQPGLSKHGEPASPRGIFNAWQWRWPLSGSRGGGDGVESSGCD
jgi:hypothetical protein